MSVARRCLVGTLALALLGAASCSGVDRAAEQAEQTAKALEGVHFASDACTGQLVPPTGYQQETAFEPLTTPNAMEVAIKVARTRLRDRICQKHRCEQAEGFIEIWKPAHDGRQVCVMAVASRAKIDEFHNGPRRDLERELAKLAAQIVAGARDDGRKPTLIIDSINDNGVNGGPRAEWLHGMMLTALGNAGAMTRRPPPRWSGLDVPDFVDGVVRGRVITLPGQEAILEVAWQVELETNLLAPGSASFPQAIAPKVDPDTHMPALPKGKKIALHMETRPGGALCEGQTTELWLEAKEPVYARVLNLYGKDDGALMIYSTGDQRLPANQPTSLGVFLAVKATEVPVERFIVVSSPTREGLARFENLTNVCRMPGSMAWDLHNSRNLPEGMEEYISSTDYRLMSGEECAEHETPDPSDLNALLALPACW